MKFNISHITEYSYSEKVFFEPHFLRFKPKTSPHLSIASFNLEVSPIPVGFSEQIDTENNHIRLYWFEDTHQSFRISVSTYVDVTPFNPFNFLIHPPEFLELPFIYDDQTFQLLKPALTTTPMSKAMNEYLLENVRKSNNNTLEFLTKLTRQIHEDFVLGYRELGPPLNPEETFKRKDGSCRDLAWMQIQLFRNMGIASRFVSGYFYLQADKPLFELHAWVEAFLPGAGWIGFDPGHGIITDCYHIPLASSAFPENTMPVTGTVRGSAEATLKNDLNITPIT
ncbi:MAG: transglutaminase family protein [Melioribacteraceae bacterium]|nr:transglutaminase family protein [Melioribacteraceae bacterium]MCF8263153.1 transglutaminase family protein [Melioribacteraceae bacterium]MCF8430383.1 transglutaminase family protein [Melioribacteraceae bacterium]